MNPSRTLLALPLLGILGLATALGETAPLLLIGMVAFVDNYPSAPPEGFLDPATARRFPQRKSARAWAGSVRSTSTPRGQRNSPAR